MLFMSWDTKSSASGRVSSPSLLLPALGPQCMQEYVHARVSSHTHVFKRYLAAGIAPLLTRGPVGVVGLGTVFAN